VTWRGLLAMGFVGGLLPSPSAVVVLLGAIALGRAWLGVLLVVVYGLGMAASLTGAGLLLLRARRALDRRATVLRPDGLIRAATRLVPIATAVFIVAVGLYLTVQGAAQI
jgi:nickel/cobalt exporter